MLKAVGHLGIVVKDIEALKHHRIEMLDQKPRIGLRGKKIAFTKPSALTGFRLNYLNPNTRKNQNDETK